MGRARSGRATMIDVARAAGCSQSTVSIVLNRTPGYNIPRETRQRVAAAAVALGYRPRAADKGAVRPAAAVQDGSASVSPVRPRQGRRRPGTSFTNRVARALAIDILAGRRAQGETLPSDADLMAEFGVSRTVLREAFRVLASKGLIEARARVGTKIRDQSEWHLFDPDVLIWLAEAGLSRNFIVYLGEMRLVLEPGAAALAAVRRTPADISEMTRLIDRMGEPGISVDQFARADLDFHLAVAATARNPFFPAISALIEVALVAAFTRSWPGNTPGGAARSAAAHREILDAIVNRDGDAARTAMCAVIDEGTERAVLD